MWLVIVTDTIPCKCYESRHLYIRCYVIRIGTILYIWICILPQSWEQCVRFSTIQFLKCFDADIVDILLAWPKVRNNFRNFTQKLWLLHEIEKKLTFPLPQIADVESHPVQAWINKRWSLFSASSPWQLPISQHFFARSERNISGCRFSFQW